MIPECKNHPVVSSNYPIVACLFDDKMCEKWLGRISFSKSELKSAKCVENIEPLQQEDMRIVLQYNDENGDNNCDSGEKKKLSVGIIAAVVVIVVFIFIRWKKNYENSTEGAEIDGLTNQDDKKK